MFNIEDLDKRCKEILFTECKKGIANNKGRSVKKRTREGISRVGKKRILQFFNQNLHINLNCNICAKYYDLLLFDKYKFF